MEEFKKMAAILVNNSITSQNGQNQKARQGKEKIMNMGSFLKICSREIFFLTGGSQKKICSWKKL